MLYAKTQCDGWSGTLPPPLLGGGEGVGNNFKCQ